MASRHISLDQHAQAGLQFVLERAQQRSSLLALVFLLVCSIFLLGRSKSASSLPPGPWRLPLLGNIHQTPFRDIWKTYKQWHAEYGPIISMQYGQKTVISIGSYKVVKDLLDKRSAIYSTRPHLVIANYINRNLHTALLPHGDRLRVHQQMQAAILHAGMAQRYQPLQDLESKQLLHDLLSNAGQGFVAEFHRYTTSSIAALAYGRRLPDADDALIHQIDDMASATAENLQKPAFLAIEAFPVLDHLPRWLAPWKKMGDTLFAESSSVFTDLLRQGLSAKSWNWSQEVSRLNDENHSLSQLELSFMIGSLLEASTTTDKVLEFFVLAAVLHPAAVRRAQQELDAMVGAQRLPDFNDMHQLPFVNAFISEVLRWRPITPLGVPHSVIRDDEYMGYRIPQGATVLANYWALESDQAVFGDPQVFRPERWLETPKLPTGAFGFGKRACPGQHIARRSLFIVISRLLWAYDISHALDADGREIALDADKMLQSSLSGPVDLQARLVVRSERHRDVIEREMAELRNLDDLFPR